MTQAEVHTTTTCSVAEAARRIVKLVAAKEENERLQFKSKGTEAIRLEKEFEVLTDAIFAAEQVVATEKAASMAGAMAQVIVAMADTDLIASHVREQHQAHVQGYRRRIDRALYSALSVMSEASGVDPADIGGEYYARAQCDPHLCLVKALS